MNAEVKTDEQNDITAEAVVDLAVTKPNEESITGGALSSNQHGTHVAGTFGAMGNNGVG